MIGESVQWLILVAIAIAVLILFASNRDPH